jgi:hypothetical protein
MAINPNIALGIQQPQPVNMLGQMAQVMAMRQAQQEYENEGGLRDMLGQGVPEDPSKLLQYGPKGRAAYESLLKGRKEKLESDEKRNVMLGGLAGPVMDDPTPQKFNFALDRAVNFGLMTPTQKQEVLAQYGGSPESIKGYVSQIYKGSITAQAQQADATSRANNAATVGASYHSANTAAQTAANLLEFNKKKRNVIPGDNQFLTTGAFGDIQPVTGYGVVSPSTMPSAPALPPAAANAFVTTRPPVNNLGQTPPVVQPGAPTVANAAAIQQQQNIPRPTARAGYMYNEQGQQVRIPQTGVPEGLRLRPGERWNETNQSVEQVPGSALYIEKQKGHSNDLNAVKTVQTTTKWGLDRIQKILSEENRDGFNSNFGGYNAYLTQNLSGNTATVKSELDSLKSDLKNKGLVDKISAAILLQDYLAHLAD